MKHWVPLVALILLTACGSHPIKLEKIAPLIVENDGMPLFSVPAVEGYWYISSGSIQTIKSGFVYVDGAFPDPTKIPHSISISLESIERWPESLSEVLPLFKSGNYQPYLDSSLDGYTPALVKEVGIKKYGGEILKFKDFYCTSVWEETGVAPHLFDGKGIALYSSSISCPLVVNGHVHRFIMRVTTYIGAWYYRIKETYEKNEKPGDPEFPPSLDELLKNQHKENYLSSIGPTVAQLFSGIQFYGKVSQNYADIENPELLQEKIDHPEPYQPKMRSGK